MDGCVDVMYITVSGNLRTLEPGGIMVIWVGTKEGSVLFNDALNTFYLQLYGFGHMVKDHSDSKRGNLLPPHRLLFPNSSKGSFICTIPDRIAHTKTLLYQS